MATARTRKPKPPAASVRQLLQEAMAESMTKDDFVRIIEAAKGAETSAVAECPECGHSMRVRVPDFKKQFELFAAGLEQVEGKASQAQPESTTVIVERPPR